MKMKRVMHQFNRLKAAWSISNLLDQDVENYESKMAEGGFVSDCSDCKDCPEALLRIDPVHASIGCS